MSMLIDRARARIRAYRHHAHKWLHEGHSYAHLAYFGGVFYEGHGFYSGMGGILLIMGIAMVVLGDGGEA